MRHPRHPHVSSCLSTPLTDDSVADHSRYAVWLGSPVPLKLDTLRRQYRPDLLPSA